MKKVRNYQIVFRGLLIISFLFYWAATPLSVIAASHLISDGDQLNIQTGVLTKADSSTQTITIAAADTISVANGADVEITGTKANLYIDCGPGATVTLNSVTIINSWQADGAAPIKFNGTNNVLILEGDSTLMSYAVSWNDTIVLPAVEVASSTSVTIEGSGKLTATGGGTSSSYGGAGIGGGKTQNSGTIVINDGHIIAEGGYYSAGIGAGMNAIGDSGTITINDGKVEATGGNRAAGIGGAGGGNSNGGTISIYGGTIITSSGNYGAGIGGGTNGTSGTISIFDGTITSSATGSYGAGIGSGYQGDAETINISGGVINATGADGGAGIGGAYDGDGGTITVSGGSILATTANNGPGIGGGMNGNGGTIVISGGTVDATGVGVGSGIGNAAGTTGGITVSGPARVFATGILNSLSGSPVTISGSGFICLGLSSVPSNVNSSSHSHDTSLDINGGMNTINDYSVPSSWTTKSNSGYFLISGGPHQVSFEENGGSAVSDLGVVDGSKIDSPASTKAGYDLAEWYQDPSFETLWDFRTNMVLTDITLYAKWIEADLSSNLLVDNDTDGVLIGVLGGASGLTIALNNSITYRDNHYFRVNGNQLIFSDTVDISSKASYTINLTITTAGGVSVEKVFTITVKRDGSANGGVANSDSYTALVNSSIENNPEKNDVLSTGASAWVEMKIISPPTHGTAEIGSIIYTPDSGYSGSDALNYIVCDDTNYCVRGSISYLVRSASAAASPSASNSPTNLPQTGFPPERITNVEGQDERTGLQNLSQISLDIPSIGISAPIVGVPVSDSGWDLTWLGSRAGWLEGTAFPSWAGNSTITAHVWGADGQPGLFYGLDTLTWGDRVVIHAYGQEYVYEVRSVDQTVDPGDVSPVFQHEELPWLTLITCKGFNSESNDYTFRVVVQAVQVKIQDK
jgi:LPXTG-site transpeptidase (sortase) family protein